MASRGRKFNRGFTHAGGLLSPKIKQTSSQRGFAETRLLTHWVEIVGPQLAKIAKPSKVRYERGGLGATLTVLTSGARAPELQMQLQVLREKVNACYGYNAITKIRITQTDAANPGFAEPQTAFDIADAPKRIADPEKISQLDLEKVSDDGLRAALESLSQTILSK